MQTLWEIQAFLKSNLLMADSAVHLHVLFLQKDHANHDVVKLMTVA